MAGEPHITSPTEDTWAVLALPPEAAPRHYRVLEALRTVRPDPVTGVRSIPRDRLAAAARLDPDTVKQTVRELAEHGVIAYTAGQGRGRNSQYWIIPVGPDKVMPAPGKGGSEAPPFMVPGKGGWAAAEKGGRLPAKRGVRSTRLPAETQTQEYVLQEYEPQERKPVSPEPASAGSDEPAPGVDQDHGDHSEQRTAVLAAAAYLAARRRVVDVQDLTEDRDMYPDADLAAAALEELLIVNTGVVAWQVRTLRQPRHDLRGFVRYLLRCYFAAQPEMKELATLKRDGETWAFTEETGPLLREVRAKVRGYRLRSQDAAGAGAIAAWAEGQAADVAAWAAENGVPVTARDAVLIGMRQAAAQFDAERKAASA